MPPDLTNRGIAAYEAGDRSKARQLLARSVLHNPRDAAGWFYLSQVVDQEDQKRDCLQRALAIDPHHPAARASLAALSLEPTLPHYLPDFLTPQQREAI